MLHQTSFYYIFPCTHTHIHKRIPNVDSSADWKRFGVWKEAGNQRCYQRFSSDVVASSYILCSQVEPGTELVSLFNSVGCFCNQQGIAWLVNQEYPSWTHDVLGHRKYSFQSLAVWYPLFLKLSWNSFCVCKVFECIPACSLKDTRKCWAMYPGTLKRVNGFGCCCLMILFYWYWDWLISKLTAYLSSNVIAWLPGTVSFAGLPLQKECVHPLALWFPISMWLHPLRLKLSMGLYWIVVLVKACLLSHVHWWAWTMAQCSCSTTGRSLWRSLLDDHEALGSSDGTVVLSLFFLLI